MRISFRISTCGLLLSLSILAASPRQQPVPDSPVELYGQLRAFRIEKTAIRVQNFELDRDGVQMTFSGDFYPAEPIGGGIYGAVFVGQGRLHHEPQIPFEKESARRFLNTTSVDSTFNKAVLRFSDDTYQRLSEKGTPGGATASANDAQKLASELEKRLVQETGFNLSSRLTQSIANGDNPGIFFAEVDGGSRGRFSVVVDHQGRVPTDVFEVNGGEKGLIFKYEGVRYGNDIWAAFYDGADFKRGSASYSDSFDLVTIPVYKMDVDLRDPGNWLRMTSDLQMRALADRVRVVPMHLNEGLAEFDNVRRNKGIRVLSAETTDGKPIGVIQDEWETGVSLVLPAPLAKGDSVIVRLKLEGKDSLWSWGSKFNYPRSTTSWYPRHGYLARSKFEIVYHHDKNSRVASIGQRVREGADKGDEWITEWHADDPVALATFVVGPFQRHTENFPVAGKQFPIEYYSPPGNIQAVKEDFILAEIGNAVNFFDNLFGAYPYGRLGGAFFPTSYGQGFPTLLLLPVRGIDNPREFAFMAHENAHQWWGNIVGWRSYRDQWLSEGFAEYSGVLYTRLRSNSKDGMDLVKAMRRDLLASPTTSTGLSKLKLYEVGPLIMGYRLNSSKSDGAAELIYNKGALVLRMLHYLLSDPTSMDDSAFFTMMKDFVDKHRNGVATTESFMQIAGQHFARTPIAQRYGLKDLGWFLEQWVYQSGLPDYHLDYKVEASDGSYVLRGTLLQQNVPDSWAMALPIVMEFDKGQIGRSVVAVSGPKSPVEIRLPDKPKSVRLDPDLWILSGKTTEKAN